jgi:dTDP-4-dehydrorhamnose 3,5-epimerase
VGTIQLVLYDGREGSPTYGRLQELVVGEPNYCLVTVPPLIWSGFKGVGADTALVANCATLPHQEGEIERADPFAGPVPFDWSLPHG